MLIVHCLNNQFKLYYSSTLVHADVLRLDGIDYLVDDNSKENEGFIGFFDWLRNDNRLIMGIRLCFFEHQKYNDFLIQLPYVTATFDNKCMEILFEEGSFNSDLSGDQDFSDNYVYQSESGEYLFTFGLDNLTNDELKNLQTFCEVIP